jgi:hypothetical protein
VIDLSSFSDEEDLIAATSHEFEFAQRLFGELNHVVLGPPSDDKIIVLSDSNEEEVREEKSTGIEDAVVSTAVKLASTAKPRTLVRPRPAFRLHPLLLVISDR